MAETSNRHGKNAKCVLRLSVNNTFQNLTFNETKVFYKEMQGKCFVPQVLCC